MAKKEKYIVRGIPEHKMKGKKMMSEKEMVKMHREKKKMMK